MLNKIRFLTEQIHTAISCVCTATEGLTVRNHNHGRREGREQTSYIHSNGDVASAEELAIDAELREVGPAEVLLAPLTERLVVEHIERLEGRAERPQNLHHRVGEAALREVLGPLHEEHHLVRRHHLVQRLLHARRAPLRRRQAPHRPEPQGRGRRGLPRERHREPSGLRSRGEGERDGRPGERRGGGGGGGHRGGWRVEVARRRRRMGDGEDESWLWWTGWQLSPRELLWPAEKAASSSTDWAEDLLGLS